jgi:hypothetical protein
MQTNGTYFNEYPNLASADYIKPQRSIHRAVSIEQKVSDYTLRVEGFYNNFWDIVDIRFKPLSPDPSKIFFNVDKLKTHGIEFMIKINDDSDQGLFGWGSYTYSQSKKFRALDDDYPNEWSFSYYDQTHVVKIVSGYTYRAHTISAKFQLYSTIPYDPIIGSHPEGSYPDGSPRYVPEYGKRNSARLSPSYQLDLRYSHITNYRWGYVSWYFEIINATNYQGEYINFDYRYNYNDGSDPTRSKNPKKKKNRGLAMFPNFGVEAKF